LSETRKRSISKTKLALLIVLLVLAGLLPAHISVTLTPSLNHRVFFLIFNPDPQRIDKGDYVLLNIDQGIVRQFIDKPHADKIMKTVGCTSGSFLSVEGKDYYCDGVFLGHAKDVSLAGKPLRHYVFNGTIPGGRLFVIGEHKDSFDSRYFGLVDVRKVIAQAYPLL
jgi:conjugal transfer pilin signal peptidase TrbI